jgi:predicted GTPase
MCYVLVDCTRGLCQGDLSIINFLKKNRVPWQVVLTKADLLPVTLLAQSIQVVKEDLNEKFNSNNLLKLNPIIPISASTGAGIQDFWKDINHKVSQSVKIVDYDVQEHVVREHHLADVLRKETILQTLKIKNKLPSKKHK